MPTQTCIVKKKILLKFHLDLAKVSKTKVAKTKVAETEIIKYLFNKTMFINFKLTKIY